MYCPNCGSDNSKTQNYCRFCGLNLVQTGKSLKSQLAFGERSYRLNKSDRIKRLINQATDVLTIVFFAVLMTIFLLDADYLKTFLTISVAIYFSMQFLKLIVYYWQRSQVRENVAASAKEFETKETNKLLEDKPFEAIASPVREDSTRLLHVENKTRKFN